jgi:hypothetical protein
MTHLIKLKTVRMKFGIRILKVLPGFRSGPRINLEGKWLEESGINIGEKIAIITESNKLTIINANIYENEKDHRQLLNLTNISPDDVIVQYKDVHDIWRKEVIKVDRSECYYRIKSIPSVTTPNKLDGFLKVV